MSDIEEIDNEDAPWRVRLVMPVGEAASTPVEAVREFKRTILDVGLREFVYRVEEMDSGDTWYVFGDEQFTPDEAAEAFGLDEPGGDADDDSDADDSAP